jgi:cytochrome P450/class 3 adenylate cyclase/tetratricopeptide (TPR) repeat protein
MKCARCDSDVPTDAKFCPECGANLANDGRFASPQSYTPKHLAEKILSSRHSVVGERKQISVMFADVKGSMELLADRDPEEARALLDPVLELMMEAVHRYEGTVSQVMGDGIMALFGAPLAHEDHAVRACYAALRIQETLAQQARSAAEAAPGAHDVPVRVRIGLNSGEVVVRSVGSDLRMDYSAVGQTAHLAARMEQIALPGTILITAESMRAVEGYVQATSLGPQTIKGLAAPVEVFEITGAGPVRTRLQAAVARGLTQFTGRDEALARLRETLATASAGQGHVLSIVGEPGIGKSRLVHEFIHGDDTRGWLVLETGAASYGRATAYLPIVRLLRDYFKVQDRDDDARVHAKVGASIAALDDSLAWTLPPLLSLLDVAVDDAAWQELDPAQRQRRIVDALRRLFLRQAQAQPLVLVFEDLHAFDSESEALLDSFVDNIPALPVLVITTFRPDYSKRWNDKPNCSLLRLDPLPSGGAEDLLKALLGQQPELRPVAEMLIERTAGNPFFLEEGVRALIETGVVAGERGGFHLVKDLREAQTRIPATVQAVLAARIDRLSADEKWLLQSAATIGRNVPFSLLQAISENSETELRGMLAHLQAAEFLYETSLFPELEYTFKHALTQEVAYNALVLETRRALNARIVDVLERLDLPHAADQTDRLAHHAQRGELWGKAITYLHQAGLKATARNASQEAVRCVEQALDALAHLPETRDTLAQGIDLRFDLHAALIPLGDFPRIVKVLREAEGLANRIDDPRRQGRVSAAMATWSWCIGDPDRALDYAKRSRAMALALHDDALEALVNHREGEAHVSLGNFRLAIDAFGRNLVRRPSAASAHRYGMAALQSVTSRNWSAWCLAGLGEFETAHEVAAQSVEIAEAASHPYSLAATYMGLGQRFQMRGEFDAAIPALERAIDICKRSNFGPLYKYGAPNLGLALVRAGRVEEGLELLERLSRQSTFVSIVPFQVLELTNLSEARLAAGQRERARESAEQGLALLRLHRQRFAEPEALRVLGDICASDGPAGFDDAARCYREAIALASDMGMRPLLARCHLAAGSMHLVASQRSASIWHLTKAVALLGAMGMRFWLEQAEAAIAQHRAESLTSARSDVLFDPASREFHANPYPFYHRLRAEDPVHRTAQGYWVVTRYPDVMTVMRDQRFGREDFGPAISAVYGDDSERVPRPMVFRDPPAHTRLRSLVSKAFTSRVVEGLKPRIREIVDGRLDLVQQRGTMDVIADLAYPLPVTVICELLGAPPEDADTMRQWTADITRSLDALGLHSDREIVKRGRAARHSLGEYFRGLLPERRAHPRADLLSQLLAAEEQGDKLSEDELIATCVLIFIAGHETTVNLIGNGLLALLRHPEQLERVQADPALIAGAVEELLRYDSPVQRTARVATEDVEIGGKTIPKHALVVAAIGAANRDPEQFADPDRFDIARQDNHHVAFGFGIHFCLGAPLARVEAQIAIETLLRRMPRLALAGGSPEWRQSSTLRGLTALPVSF